MIGFRSSSSCCSTSSAHRPTSYGECLRLNTTTLITTPTTFISLTPHRQDFLESAFPAYPKNQQPSSKTKKEKDQAEPTPPKLSIRNTIIKFILDQTIGAVLNTLLFSTFTHSIRLATSPTQRITSLPKAISYWMSPGSVDFGRVNWSLVWELSLDEFWSIFVAGWKLWPAVSVVNFTLVKTVEGRNLVGSLAGVVWGVYMSLISAQ